MRNAIWIALAGFAGVLGTGCSGTDATVVEDQKPAKEGRPVETLSNEQASAERNPATEPALGSFPKPANSTAESSNSQVSEDDSAGALTGLADANPAAAEPFEDLRENDEEELEIVELDWADDQATPGADAFVFEIVDIDADEPLAEADRPTSKIDESSIISAEQLVQAYREDEVAAKKRYKEKTITLRAQIVGEDYMSSGIIVRGGLYEYSEGVFFDNLMKIDFSDRTDSYPLHVGQRIVCQGICNEQSPPILYRANLVRIESDKTKQERLDLAPHGLPLSIMAPEGAEVIKRSDLVRIFGLGMDIIIDQVDGEDADLSDRLEWIKEKDNRAVIHQGPNEVLFSFVPGLDRVMYSFNAYAEVGDATYKIRDDSFTAHREVAEGMLKAARTLQASPIKTAE